MSNEARRLNGTDGFAPDDKENGLLTDLTDPLKTAVRQVRPGNSARPTTTLTFADVLDVISNERRRLTIHALAAHEGAVVGISELSTAVASAEFETPPAELDRRERKRIHVGMLQTHLPALDDAGVLEFDIEGRNRVHIDQRVERLSNVLADWEGSAGVME